MSQPNTQTPQVIIYTDGGAVPNPGTGGYGIIIIDSDQREHVLSGSEPDTTNNRMELTAACVALETLTTRHQVLLYTDSQYVQKGITQWISNWIRKGWKDVKNADLWQRLYAATQQHDITWKWIRGHAGNAYNERVDQLATAAREQRQGKTPTPQPTAPAAPQTAYDHIIYTAVQFSTVDKIGAWALMTHSPANNHDTPAITHQDGGAVIGITEYELALRAVIAALSQLQASGAVLLHTPNELVYKGATAWIKNWRKNGWKNSKGADIAHMQSWQQLNTLMQGRTIQWQQQTHPETDLLAMQYFKQTDFL